MIAKQIVFFEFVAGTNIAEAIKYSLYYSRDHDAIVKFGFNGVNMEIEFDNFDTMPRQQKFLESDYCLRLKELAKAQKQYRIASKVIWCTGAAFALASLYLAFLWEY